MRRISQSFLNALTQGILKPVVDAVKDHQQNLILCFREGYINIYYKSHSLFKITQQREKYKLSFNIRHGRYTDSIDSIEKRLKNICPNIQFNSSDEAWFYGTQEIHPQLPTIIDTYKGYIDDFFNPDLRYDYIKEAMVLTKKDLLEKVRQQELFIQYSEPSGIGEELVFYDMELSIPNTIKGEEKKGSPDCLAVSVKDGKVSELILVEVKSNGAACGGTHGIAKHFKDFSAMIGNQEDTDLLYSAMKTAFDHYHALGMYSGVKTVPGKDGLKFSVKFIFTDKAIDWARNNRQKNENYKCYQSLDKTQILLL